MSPELLKEVPFVKQGIHQVRVVVERISQAGVDDLQHHPNHFFNDAEVLGIIWERDIAGAQGTSQGLRGLLQNLVVFFRQQRKQTERHKEKPITPRNTSLLL